MNLTAVYNADNQLTQWGTTAMTYDANGNTLNDGANSYVWDARNRLASANGTGASFAYDPLGRRVSKTFMSATTNYLYDGANAVQESGTLPTANLLTGGVDERFLRTTSTETDEYLTDALGSTVALTNATGAVEEQYSYGPYGILSATGMATTNSYAYTGREIDGLGIDYYRARYYNPNTGRFLSEDPLGFAGSGTNFYAYVYNSPTNFRDPSGKFVFLVTAGIGAVAGGGGDIAGQIIANIANQRDWDNIDWTEAGVATAVGAVSGALAPFTATTYAGAAMMGAVANMTQTAATNAFEGKCTSAKQMAWSAATGAAGGLMGGPAPSGNEYDSFSPWLDQSLANSLNQQNLIDQAVAGGSFLRNVAGGFVSGFPNLF
jgi:RHS repeat-associated protein